MKIFLDFDSTLFDSSRLRGKFLIDLRSTIQSGGWTKEEVAEQAKVFSGSAFEGGRLYNICTYLDFLEEKYPHGRKEETLARVEEFMQDLRAYVFSDALSFLQTQQKEDAVIVTYGDDTFQRTKVKSSGVEEYVSEVIVVDTLPKVEAIGEWLEDHGVTGETVFFIDDKTQYFDALVESNPHGIIGILMDRNMELQQGNAKHHVKDFRQVADIIGSHDL